MLNHIAELEHQLFQLKMRLNEPLSKLESLMRKLAAPLPREFRYQQVRQTLYEYFTLILVNPFTGPLAYYFQPLFCSNYSRKVRKPF